MTINSKNERIKKQYAVYLKEAKSYSPSTINNALKAILRFEEHLKHKDLSLTKDNAISFKKQLASTKSKQLNEPLSLSTISSTMNNLKDFFRWLSYQEGYKRKINVSDIEYLSLSNNEARAAKAVGFRPHPTIEQVEEVLNTMPTQTEANMRDRALVAFILITGVRNSAAISLKLKHIDLKNRLVMQNPKEVNTKTRKHIDTFFMPVSELAEKIFVDWVKYLVKEKLYSPNDPLFPKTKVVVGDDNSFENGGLEPKHWSSTSVLTDLFKKAFACAELPYFNPHSFRKTLVAFGEQVCNTPEEFKAWSQNLGHESPLTTFISYGYVPANKQGDIIKNLKFDDKPSKMDEIYNMLKNKILI